MRIHYRESNCNIDNDYEEGTLFYDESRTQKKDTVKQELKDKILSGNIRNNISGLKYALHRGCLPSIFVKAVEELKEQGKVEIIGTFNEKATNIHKIKRDRNDYYRIKTL